MGHMPWLFFPATAMLIFLFAVAREKTSALQFSIFDRQPFRLKT
jgi:hypothetical protein